MKKFFSIITALVILLGGLHPTVVSAATFVDFSLSGSDYTPSASGVTYTISFTTVTDVTASNQIIYAIWPTGFVVPADQNDVTITVNGTPQTIDSYGNWSSNLQFISISNTVVGGSDVVVTVNNVTNANSAGVHTFTWIRSANGGGGAIDEASPTPTITLGAVSRTLTYSAETGGTLSGSTSQTVSNGGNGSAVTAIPNNGYYFVRWSDGSTQNPRTDLSVGGDITVSAIFAQNTSRPVIAPLGAFQQDPSFKINNGESETSSRAVTLSFDVNTDSVAYYAVSEDPGMAGVMQQAYAGSVPFTLSEELGEKKVYVYLYSTTGQSSKLLEQTISLVEAKKIEDPVIEATLNGVSSESESNVSVKNNLEPEKTVTQETEVVPEKSVYQFTRNLRRGDTGADVGKLREFLDAHGYSTANVSLSELSVQARETFDTGLFNAVVVYQEAHPEEILRPIDLTKGTGNFFIYTRTFVNSQLR